MAGTDSAADLNVGCPVGGVEAPVTGPVLLLAVGVGDELLRRQVGPALRTLWSTDMGLQSTVLHAFGVEASFGAKVMCLHFEYTKMTPYKNV